MYFIYVITDNRKIHIGQTNSLKRRFSDHLKKQVKSTKRFSTFKMFIIEECEDRGEAMRREKFYKSFVGRKITRNNLEQDLLEEYKNEV